MIAKRAYIDEKESISAAWYVVKSMIHRRSRIGSGARIGGSVCIASYCRIDGSVRIGQQADIGEWVNIDGHARIGNFARIGEWSELVGAPTLQLTSS